MEKIVRWLFILLAGLLAAFSLHAQDLNAAVSACATGDYLTAIGLFESAVQAGAREGSLYYNLGVCYAGAGQPGKALVNLLRAAAYIPRDADLNAHIARLRAERLDLPEDESDWLTLMGTITGNFLTFGELSLLAYLVWAAFFVLLTVYRLSPVKRDGLKIVTGTAGILLLLMLLLMGSRTWVESNRPAGVILAEAVQAMSGPGPDYLRLFTLSEASEIRILEAKNNWLRIVLPGGRQGWIEAKNVERVNP